MDEVDGDNQVPYFGQAKMYRSGESLDRNNQVPYTGQEQTYRLEYLILGLDLEPRICDWRGFEPPTSPADVYWVAATRCASLGSISCYIIDKPHNRLLVGKIRSSRGCRRK